MKLYLTQTYKNHDFLPLINDMFIFSLKYNLLKTHSIIETLKWQSDIKHI